MSLAAKRVKVFSGIFSLVDHIFTIVSHFYVLCW